jgi:hypothetical protein
MELQLNNIVDVSDRKLQKAKVASCEKNIDFHRNVSS